MKTRLKYLLSIAMCTALIGSSSPQPARAHDNEIGTQERVQNLQEIYRLKSERDTKHKGPAIAGVTLSSVALTSGAFLLAGAPMASFLEDDLNNASKTMIAAGSVALVGGVIGVVVSARKLRANKRDAKELNHQIQQLERENERVSISYGAPQPTGVIKF